MTRRQVGLAMIAGGLVAFILGQLSMFSGSADAPGDQSVVAAEPDQTTSTAPSDGSSSDASSTTATAATTEASTTTIATTPTATVPPKLRASRYVNQTIAAPTTALSTMAVI